MVIKEVLVFSLNLFGVERPTGHTARDESLQFQSDEDEENTMLVCWIRSSYS